MSTCEPEGHGWIMATGQASAAKNGPTWPHSQTIIIEYRADGCVTWKELARDRDPR